MLLSSTNHFSWPTSIQPPRSCPLKSLTHCSLGNFVRIPWPHAAAHTMMIEKIKRMLVLRSPSQKSQGRLLLYADFSLDRAGDALPVLLNLRQIGRLHHHANQRLGAREPYQHASGSAQSFFTSADFMPNRKQFRERLLLAHAHVIQALRIDLEAARERIQVCAGALGNFEKAHSGQQAVTGSGIFAKDHVAGLLAAQRSADAHHFFEDILI